MHVELVTDHGAPIRGRGNPSPLSFAAPWRPLGGQAERAAAICHVAQRFLLASSIALHHGPPILSSPLFPQLCPCRNIIEFKGTCSLDLMQLIRVTPEPWNLLALDLQVRLLLQPNAEDLTCSHAPSM